MDGNISQERLQVIYEAVLRQVRNGIDKSKIIVNLYAKGFEEEEAEALVSKAYAEYLEEKRQVELKERYDTPLVPIPTNFLKTIFRGIVAWVLSVFTGHLISPEHLKKRSEKRVE